MVTVPYDSAFLHCHRRIVNDCIFHQTAQILQRINIVIQFLKQRTLHVSQNRPDMRQHGEGRLEGCQISWIG